MFNLSACPENDTIPFLYEAMQCSPRTKPYWDQKYGYSISTTDFSEITSNLKRFALFLKDI
jgi:hypothetical protein